MARLRDEVAALRSARDADRRRLETLEAQVAAIARRPAVEPAVRSGPAPAIPAGLAVVRVEPPDPHDDEGSAFIVDLGSGERARAARPAVGGPTGGVDAAPPLPTEVELKEPEAAAPPAPTGYREGLDALAAGDAARAAGLLERFVAEAPADPAADNALVALGDAWVKAGEPARGLAAYERAATGYPAGDAVPVALLRYGETCQALGRKAAARAAFRRVVDDHPGTAPAELARSRLTGLEAGF